MSVDAEKAKKFLRFDIALNHVRNRRPLEAERLARLDDVPERRAYILTLIANHLVVEEAADTARAIQYLEEAQRIASTLNNKENLAVLIGTGSVYARFDAVRATEILPDVIKVSNKLPEFTGDSSISNVFAPPSVLINHSPPLQIES